MDRWEWEGDCWIDRDGRPRRFRERGPGAGWVNPDRENRTKSESPYAYSEYFVFRHGGRRDGYSWNFGKDTHADYSDRLWQWDYEKARKACEGIEGRMTHWGPDSASKFLSAYYGRPIECLALAEGCNPSSGYPYWIFWYRHAEVKPVSKPEKTEAL